MANKYGARRTWSNLCNRTFSSKLEAQRGEELCLLQLAGEISELNYQEKFVLSEEPKVTITIDFCYHKKGDYGYTYEDTKGMGETREFRVKRLWLREKLGIDVILIRETR